MKFFVVLWLFIDRIMTARGVLMASKKIRRRDLIQQIVTERGGISVGALAEMLGVSTQTVSSWQKAD
jgi:predicted transcriptional regulator